MKLKLLTILTLLHLNLPTLGHAAQIYISIGDAKVKKSVLALPATRFSGGASSAELGRIANVVQTNFKRDLGFTALFEMKDPDAFIEPPSAGLTLDTFKLTDWQTIGAEFLIKTGVSIENGIAMLELRLYDVIGGKQILGKKYSAKTDEVSLMAHTAANQIMEALTGRSGMFTSRLAFVCSKGGSKEIYTADFDGQNPKALTSFRTIAFAPAWSPDGKHLAFSLITKNSKNIKNIDLYEYDFDTRKSVLLANQKGTNSGAAYSPDGTKIALTMSFLGNQEIFLFERGSKKVTKISKSFGFDVDPSWSPNGKSIAFVSSRAGVPMVYSMNADGSGVNRLTYAGRYNATPSFSPDGKKIAFAGWNDGHFDVFMMSTDGSNLERLTKDEGSNEDTHYSPDGNFIAFSSTRAGQKNIYAIAVDGKTTHRLTYGLGECDTPKWSAP